MAAVVAGGHVVVSGDFRRVLLSASSCVITDPLFYAAAIPAVTLLGLAKGGFSGLGTLSLPLMALVVSPVQAAAITLPILIVQDVVSVWAYRYTWDKRNVVILVVGATTGIVTGYLLAAQVSDAAIKLAVGLISIAFGADRRHRRHPPDNRKRLTGCGDHARSTWSRGGANIVGSDIISVLCRRTGRDDWSVTNNFCDVTRCTLPCAPTDAASQPSYQDTDPGDHTGSCHRRRLDDRTTRCRIARIDPGINDHSVPPLRHDR